VISKAQFKESQRKLVIPTKPPKLVKASNSDFKISGVNKVTSSIFVV